MRRYYEEEMRYLHEAAKDFADAHPEQARYLNIDSVSDRDPYVERLFEGFAFLTGRIHKQLDDEMPEYTESLLQLLYPHFLKPVPALSIVEFAIKPGLVQETKVLERGAEVRSDPVGDEGVRCRFTTTQDVHLQPIHLKDVELRYGAGGTSSMKLHFELERGVAYSSLDMGRVRLYLRADASIASTMHLFFTRHVSHLKVTTPETNSSLALRGQRWVTPGGLAEDEGALPYEPNTFSGFRLLQEYMCFRRKFWFVDVRGLDRFEASDDVDEFAVEISFDRSYPEERRFQKENIRLYCTPVVNLFETDAEPIRITGEMAEHRIIPSMRYRRGVEAYDVQNVVGMEEATGRQHQYKPFFSFDHRPKDHRTSAEQGRFYTTSRRLGPTDRPEIHLSLSDAQLKALESIPAETLSVELRCTNGSLPREMLAEGMISKLAPDMPNIAEPRNLTQPTLIQHPPNQEESDFFWKLISHWSLNYKSVATKNALIALLELYDWTSSSANQRRLDGLREVNWKPKETMDKGAVLRGAEVTIEVEEGHFADEGDLCLFGLVLSRFFSMYATINSFVHLVIVTNPSEKRYEWTPRRGARTNL